MQPPSLWIRVSTVTTHEVVNSQNGPAASSRKPKAAVHCFPEEQLRNGLLLQHPKQRQARRRPSSQLPNSQPATGAPPLPLLSTCLTGPKQELPSCRCVDPHGETTDDLARCASATRAFLLWSGRRRIDNINGVHGLIPACMNFSIADVYGA